MDWHGYDLRRLHGMDTDEVALAIDDLRDWLAAVPPPSSTLQAKSEGFHLTIADDLLTVPPGRRDAALEAVSAWIAMANEATRDPSGLAARMAKGAGAQFPRLLVWWNNITVNPESILDDGLHWIDDGRDSVHFQGRFHHHETKADIGKIEGEMPLPPRQGR